MCFVLLSFGKYPLLHSVPTCDLFRCENGFRSPLNLGMLCIDEKTSPWPHAILKPTFDILMNRTPCYGFFGTDERCYFESFSSFPSYVWNCCRTFTFSRKVHFHPFILTVFMLFWRSPKAEQEEVPGQ